MNYNNFVVVLILIVIPLILLILCYRKYVHNYCQNDMQCLKKKLIFNLNNLSNFTNSSDSKNLNKEISNANELNADDNIEGFFGGLNSWFSGSAPTNLPVSAGSLKSENLPILEKKINDKMNISKTFPPPEASDDFKDSNNSELLQNIGAKPMIKPESINKIDTLLINNNALRNSMPKINDIKKAQNFLKEKMII